jgi:hypothetical protein
MKKTNTKKAEAPLMIEIPAKDVNRIEKVTHGETPTEWCLAVLRDVLETEEKAAEFKATNPDDPEAEKSWEKLDRYFRPLTPQIVARQLREMQERWYCHNDREMDTEDDFESWMLAILIDSIESGGLKLKLPAESEG